MCLQLLLVPIAQDRHRHYHRQDARGVIWRVTRLLFYWLSSIPEMTSLTEWITPVQLVWYHYSYLVWWARLIIIWREAITMTGQPAWNTTTHGEIVVTFIGAYSLDNYMARGDYNDPVSAFYTMTKDILEHVGLIPNAKSQSASSSFRVIWIKTLTMSVVRMQVLSILSAVCWFISALTIYRCFDNVYNIQDDCMMPVLFLREVSLLRWPKTVTAQSL